MSELQRLESLPKHEAQGGFWSGACDAYVEGEYLLWAKCHIQIQEEQDKNSFTVFICLDHIRPGLHSNLLSDRDLADSESPMTAFIN